MWNVLYVATACGIVVLAVHAWSTWYHSRIASKRLAEEMRRIAVETSRGNYERRLN
jgi:hypothetical protein